MAVYAVGDLQGCLEPLERLMEQIRFDPAQDRIWFTGDIVNRGPASLGTLRFVKQLGELAVMVLGNHDLHLLATAWADNRPRKKRDTLTEILEAPDRDELLDWLRRQPFLHHDAALNFTLVHAGLPPQWDLADARAAAREIEAVFAGPEFINFLHEMYGNLPNLWSSQLEGFDRIRFIVNAFTRMRFLHPDGSLDLVNKGPADRPRRELIPWYRFPGRRSIATNIVFGHWSLLGELHLEGVYGVDSGCVYGGRLTALRLDDLARTAVDCGPGLHRKRPG